MPRKLNNVLNECFVSLLRGSLQILNIRGMKKLIPPFLFLICIILMVLIRNVIVIEKIIPQPYNYLGIILLLLGIVMTIKVRKLFNKIETEIHTFKKPRKLVTNGLFKFSRNPIYLGFLISLLGVWVLLGTLIPILVCVLFILVTNYWYISFEEKEMEKQFGAEYRAYKSKVNRWI